LCNVSRRKILWFKGARRKVWLPVRGVDPDQHRHVVRAFVIIVVGLHAPFLPSGWGMF